MTRSSTDPLYAFHPKIEKTLRRLRKARSLVVNNSRSSDSVINFNQWCTDNSVASSNIFVELGQMENNDRTLKELATPDVCMFLEKFFPASRTVTIRKEICGIRQHTRETLHEYWERFNKLYATCPHHQISEQLLIQYFYEGLSMMDRSMIDAASGGALMDKTLAATRHLISNMARSSQSWMVNEIGAASNQRLKNQLTELSSLVRQLVVGQHQPAMAAKVCGICTSVEHLTDMCPTF
ncbi:hypothetical protein CR513_28221, partial [Mucuna pruriens]